MTLLSVDEPAPFALVNEGGKAPFLLICDHASRQVPRALAALGLEEWQLKLHIGWDIGAAETAEALSRHFDAPLLLAGYSRLVIDLNRRLNDQSAIPEVSDGVAVPGNQGLAAAAAAERAAALYHPYHAALEAALAARRQLVPAPALISVHSFTPVFAGIARPWQVGVLWDRDPRIAVPLIAALGHVDGIVVGDNQPYSAREPRGYSVEQHAGAKGYPHVALEIRQDLIDTRHGAALWAGHLASAFAPILADGALYRVEHYPSAV